MLDVIALVVVVVGVSSLAVSLGYSLPAAVARIALYPAGGARRSFAWLALYQTVAPTVVILSFLVVGIAVLALPDAPVRTALTRLTLLIAVLVSSAQVVLTPIAHRHIQELADEERRALGERQTSD